MSGVGFRPQLDDQEPIDVGIVIALQEEFDELFKDIQMRCRAVSDGQTGRAWYLFEHFSQGTQGNYSCVATFVGDMGLVPASLVTQSLINRWQPRLLVMPGIAAALSKDVLVGDVVVANQVDAYLENAKAVAARNQSGFAFEMSGEVYRTNSPLFRGAQNFL